MALGESKIREPEVVHQLNIESRRFSPQLRRRRLFQKDEKMKVYRRSIALSVVRHEQKGPWELKAGSHYELFRRARRPARPNEALSSHRFPAKIPQYSAPGGLLLGDLDTRYPAEMAGWRKYGDTILRGILSWWESERITGHPEATIADIAEAELQMYRHHAADPSSSLHHMRHSIVQQLIRQDPFLYRLAVTLRGGHAWRLMSIPGLMNEVLDDKDDIIPEFAQLAIPFASDGNRSRGEVLALSRKDSGGVPEHGCNNAYLHECPRDSHFPAILIS